jgi:hypothetical protein
MGAEGGIMWMRVKDREEFDRLTGWLSWRFMNQHCWAFKECEVPDDIPSGPDWLMGGYGTDCSDDGDLESFVDLLHYLTDPEQVWQSFAKKYTFQEFREDLETDPDIETDRYTYRNQYWSWWSAYHIITCAAVEEIRGWNLGYPTGDVLDMTLRDWAQEVLDTIDPSVDAEETWT